MVDRGVSGHHFGCRMRLKHHLVHENGLSEVARTVAIAPCAVGNDGDVPLTDQTLSDKRPICCLHPPFHAVDMSNLSDQIREALSMFARNGTETALIGVLAVVAH
jgi:hypothetical protein